MSNIAQSTAGGIGSNGPLVIDRCTVSGNTSLTGSGGGISQYGGALIVTGSTISGNRAVTGSGGGLLVGGTAYAQVLETTLADNSALTGGGLWSSANNLLLSRSTISGNRAAPSTPASMGGGIYLTAVATISACTISGNSASYSGGGIALVGPPGTLVVNSTISGNLAGSAGAAIYTFATSFTVMNSTIAFNRSATNAGAIATEDGFIGLESCIVARNFGRDLYEFGAGLFNVTRCLIGIVDGSASLDQVSLNLLGQDPLLAPLAMNGGPTQTLALKKGSPAINQGSNPLSLTTDQRGKGFKRKIGGGVDIGAFERQ